MGESQHLPLPELPGTPVSFLWGTTFHEQPKNLGDIQEPHNNMAYLLVCTGDTLEAWNYGISLVWINPNQVRASTKEEVVGTLSTYITSRPHCPYALVQLYKGSSHTPLPKDKHLGVLPQGKVEESPYGQVSQLKVCQLLSARPQVVYPVGLNGNNKPVTTTLPEPLHSNASITTNKHPYMGINIPPPPLKEPEHTALPVDKVHTIPAANSPQTPPKPRVSIVAEVNDLLTQVMADMSSHESEHSPTGKVTTVEVRGLTSAHRYFFSSKYGGHRNLFWGPPSQCLPYHCCLQQWKC